MKVGDLVFHIKDKNLGIYAPGLVMKVLPPLAHKAGQAIVRFPKSTFDEVCFIDELAQANNESR
jgi:hypothetical protein